MKAKKPAKTIKKSNSKSPDIFSGGKVEVWKNPEYPEGSFASESNFNLRYIALEMQKLAASIEFIVECKIEGEEQLLLNADKSAQKELDNLIGFMADSGLVHLGDE